MMMMECSQSMKNIQMKNSVEFSNIIEIANKDCIGTCVQNVSEIVFILHAVTKQKKKQNPMDALKNGRC